MQTSIHITDVPKALFREEEYSLGWFFSAFLDSVEKMEWMSLWNQIIKDRKSQFKDTAIFKDSLRKRILWKY